MARVEAAAFKIPNARIIEMPEFIGTEHQITSQMMTYNRQSFLNELRTGRVIFDIGPDPNRALPSFNYQMEQNMMKNYQKLHPNTLRFFKQ